MMNADRGANPKLTLLPFLITAMAQGAARMADAQRHLRRRSQRHYPHGALNLGMATQTPNGLMVAVIRDAQAKSVWDLAREIVRLAEAARWARRRARS